MGLTVQTAGNAESLEGSYRAATAVHLRHTGEADAHALPVRRSPSGRGTSGYQLHALCVLGGERLLWQVVVESQENAARCSRNLRHLRTDTVLRHPV